MNDRIRRAGTKALVSCALGVGAKIYIHQSIVWAARPPDGSPFDEGSPMNPDMITSSAVDAEFISHEAGERRGLKVGILRCGQFYSADSFQTRLYSKYVMKRELPIIGKGDAV